MADTHTRTGTTKAGPQAGRLRPCAVSPDNHGFHPDGEACPYCAPAEPKKYTVSADDLKKAGWLFYSRTVPLAPTSAPPALHAPPKPGPEWWRSRATGTLVDLTRVPVFGRTIFSSSPVWYPVDVQLCGCRAIPGEHEVFLHDVTGLKSARCALKNTLWPQLDTDSHYYWKRIPDGLP